MNNHKLIFVVDDDPFISMLVSKRLTSQGYILETFEYGEECLKALDKNPDLIILDYFFVNHDRMVMNGMEVFNKIREAKPGIPVIILSGQEKGEIVLELARKGIDDYIIKDNYLIDNLNNAITELFVRKE
jgi:two-component system, OmpR family, response regulator